MDEGRFPGRQPEALREHSDQIKEWIADVPSESRIRELLILTGGPSTREELGIDEDLFKKSLREAHLVRYNRHTLLRALNEA
ncbi:hypothetical protein D3C77_701780 [compost metagenome]